MKKVLMLCVGVAFVASMSSCKRDYACKCSYAGISAESATFKATKKDAKTTCEGLQAGGSSCEVVKK